MSLVVDCSSVTPQNIESMLNHRPWDDVVLLLGKKACPTLSFSQTLLSNMPEIKVLQCPSDMDRFPFLMGYLTGTETSGSIYLLTDAKRKSLDTFTSNEFTVNIVREKEDVETKEEDDGEEEDSVDEAEVEDAEDERAGDPDNVDKAMKEAFSYLLNSSQGKKLIASTLTTAMGTEKKDE